MEEEKYTQKYSEEFLRFKNIPYIHLPKRINSKASKAFVNLKGWADLIIFLHKDKGGTIFIELKTPAGTFSIDQKQNRAKMRSLAYKYYTARDFEEFLKIMGCYT